MKPYSHMKAAIWRADIVLRITGPCAPKSYASDHTYTVVTSNGLVVFNPSILQQIQISASDVYSSTEKADRVWEVQMGPDLKYPSTSLTDSRYHLIGRFHS